MDSIWCIAWRDGEDKPLLSLEIMCNSYELLLWYVVMKIDDLQCFIQLSWLDSYMCDFIYVYIFVCHCWNFWTWKWIWWKWWINCVILWFCLILWWYYMWDDILGVLGWLEIKLWSSKGLPWMKSYFCLLVQGDMRHPDDG